LTYASRVEGKSPIFYQEGRSGVGTMFIDDSQHPRSLDGRVSEGPQAPTTTRNAASPGTSKPDRDVVTRLRVAEINPPILSAAGTTMPIAFSKRESIELQQVGAVARVRSGMSQ
jgi:hypothetical protein